MTDRELLEKAAKAAGYKVRAVGDGNAHGHVGFYTEPDSLWWNPLADDGDAFRLAVKMKMRIGVGQVEWLGSEYVGEFSEEEDIEADPCAATRLAIVRAAAAMADAT